MRHRTPLVVAVVLVVGGPGLAALAGAQPTTDDTPCRYSRTYEELDNADGFRIVVESYVVGPGGEQAEATLQPDVPSQAGEDCRATTRETLTAVVDPDSGEEAHWEVRLGYDEGETFVPPLVTPVQQNDFWLRAEESNGETHSDDRSLDGGGGLVQGVEDDRTEIVASAGSHRGQSPVTITFQVKYK